MGILDRDYYAEGPSPWGHARGPWKGAVGIIVVCCVLFLLQNLSPPRGINPLVQWGAYHPERILSGEVWRLASPLLLHASVWHLLANMLLVYWAGGRLEEMYGRGEYLAFYLLAGSAGYLALWVVDLLAGAPAFPRGALLGPNAAVTATLLVFACHFPRQQVLLFFVLPVPVWGIVALYVGLDLLGLLGAGMRSAAALDLAGMAFGLAYYYSGWRITRWPPVRWSGRLRPRLRVVVPPREEAPSAQRVSSQVVSPQQDTPLNPLTPPDLEAEVDRVLAKVARYGQASLTPEERAILVQASEWYKKRRR